jgi:DNA-directed RNA polymerase subunit M/transcription elongation factor TFIIS
MSLPDLPANLSKNAKNLTTMLTSMKGEDGKALVTKEQSSMLTNLRFTNGESRLSLEDRNFVYEICWMLSSVGFDITYNFLSADWEKVFGSHNIRKKMLFENPLLEKNREKFILDLDVFRNTVQVEAGEKCKRCGSEETISVVSVTRACDEIQQIKITCLQCSHKWKAQ